MEGVEQRNGLYGFEFRDIDKRRALEGERKSPDIKALWQSNHEIINLAARGFKQVEIAEIMSITPATVSNTLNSELGKKKLSEIRLERDEDTKKFSEKVRVLTNKAINVYHEIFDNEGGEATLKDRKGVADTVVLELSGLRVPTRVDSRHISTVLTAEELKAFKKRGTQAVADSKLAIDIEEAFDAKTID